MTESDDPVTVAIVGGAIFAGSQMSKKASKPDIPVQAKEQAKKTAVPLEQLSEQAKKNKRLQASMLTKDWAEPKLGFGGLLGVSEQR